MEKSLKNTLIVICGPTAVGKTKVSIRIAKTLNTEIVSCDSRQLFKELKIGVASPSAEELKVVPHHFVCHLSIHEYYNISRYEQEVIDWLNLWFTKHPFAVMTGGSGLYIDAVCKGIDDLPDPDPTLRAELKDKLTKEGLEPLKIQLKSLDPDYYAKVDLNNPNRILRALEVCILTGKPYSALRKNEAKSRDFQTIKIGLNLPREELYKRIDDRVDMMMSNGLLEEVKSLYAFRNLNALNTVGYKELFDFLDDKLTLDEAIRQIKTNTRRYAKRQMTWFKKDPAIHWFHPDETDKMLELVR